jgi:thiol-disulfide isomerase/thioredoxin
MRPPQIGRRRPGTAPAAVAVLAAAAALSGCSTITGGWTDGGEQAGYVSGDRSVTTWEPEDRTGPVTVAGVDFAGTPVDVSAWQGDVVVLNTWYAACPPCRAEAPDLVTLAQEYADQDVHLLGINSTDAAGNAQAFERTFSVPYPSLHDDQDTAMAALSDVVSLQAFPTTVVLDRDGKVAARILGRLDLTTLRGLVDDSLAEAAHEA